MSSVLKSKDFSNAGDCFKNKYGLLRFKIFLGDYIPQ